jgi:hypothetical protein
MLRREGEVFLLGTAIAHLFQFVLKIDVAIAGRWINGPWGRWPRGLAALA